MKHYLLKNPAIVLICFFCLSATSHANEPQWQSWTEQTLEQAKQQNRLVLIDLTAQWCMFCKKMDATTYKDKAVLAELKKHYIAIRADEAKFPELANRFAKVGRPGTIILDSNGKELLTKSGYLKPQWMLWMLQGTVAELENKKFGDKQIENAVSSNE
ncbi:MAG: DUF255 domain-containing protein [Pseudomonadota bacterium]